MLTHSFQELNFSLALLTLHASIKVSSTGLPAFSDSKIDTSLEPGDFQEWASTTCLILNGEPLYSLSTVEDQ